MSSRVEKKETNIPSNTLAASSLLPPSLTLGFLLPWATEGRVPAALHMSKVLPYSKTKKCLGSDDRKLMFSPCTTKQ